MLLLRPTVLPLLGALLLPAPAAAQSWALLRGADTLATETYARTGASVAGTLRLRPSTDVRYEMALDGVAVTRTELWQSQGANPPVHLRMRAGADSVIVEVVADAGSQRIGAAAAVRGGVPLLNLSAAFLEQLLLAARAAGGDTVQVPLLMPGPQPAPGLAATVTGASGRTPAVVIGGVRLEARVDGDGRLTGACVPSQRVEFRRVEPAGEPACAPVAAADYSAPASAPYTAEAVVVRTPAGHDLAGTLTLPRERRGPVPAVVIITGSGPQDRDGASPPIPGWRPFREIADTLGRRGIAVLRVDDRGVGGSGGAGPQVTSADFADDVRAQVAWLRARPEIDGRKIALIGHSEGGIVAPLVAQTDPALAGVVVMAGSSRPGRRILEFQNEQAILAAPLSPTQRDSVRAEVVRELDRMQAGDGWMGWFLSHDPAPVARALRVPVLVLHGATDRQVTVDQAEELGTLARAGGNADVTVRIFPAVNHLFVPDPEGTADVARYAALPDKRIPAEVRGALADWLAARLAP